MITADPQEMVNTMDSHKNTSGTSREADVRAARWAVAQCEPLIPTRRRIQLDEQMLTLVLEQPTWACAWFSGIIADHLQTLPAEDPWRNLTVNLGPDFDMKRPNSSIVNQGEWKTNVGPYAGPVQLPSGEPFGLESSWSDLLLVESSDLSIDTATAAVDEEISEEAQVMLAFAAQGWRKPFDYSRALFAQRSQTDRLAAAINLFEAGSDALRWVLHRRRVYTGMEDTMPLLSMFVWITTADFISESKPWPEADNRKFIADEKLDDGLWQRIANGTPYSGSH
jgi:hypothetical protein